MTVELAPSECDFSEGAPCRPLVHGRTLVLGLGNTLLSDEGVGVHMLDHVKARWPSDEVSFIDGGTMSFSLLGYVEEADAMLVIDAADLDEAPGTVRLIEDDAMDGFLACSRRRSVHEVGLSDLLDMARLSGHLPARRALLCIQPASVSLSDSLTAPVAAALEDATDQACGLLSRWSSP